MNIIQIQNQLKGLPDNIIAGYVQNPSGQVPAYLALSELQRRKTTREEFQKNQQAPQQSVAESLVGQSAPQQLPPQGQGQGIGALSQGQPQQPQGFAQGGIVGYADGGDIVGMKAKADAAFERGDYEEAKSLYAQLANAQESENAGNVPVMDEPQIERARAQIYNTLTAQKDLPQGVYTPDADLPVENIPSGITSLPPLTAPENKEFHKIIRDIDQPNVPMRAEVAPTTGIASLATNPQTDIALQNQLLERSKSRQLEDTKGRVKEYRESAARDQEKVRKSRAARGIEELPIENIPDRMEPPSIAPEAQNIPQTVPTTTPLAKGVKTGLESLVPPQKPMTAVEKARAEYEASLAPDQETRGNINRRLEHLDAQGKWRREHTDFDALTKAGLAMMAAGARPGATFLGSAAAGGEAGIKSLAEAREFQYATEEKRAALEDKLTQLERAEKIAIKKFGVDSAESDLAREEKIAAAKALAEAKKAESDADNVAAEMRQRISADATLGAARIHEKGRASSEAAIAARADIADKKLYLSGLNSKLNLLKEENKSYKYKPKDPRAIEIKAAMNVLSDEIDAASKGERYAAPETTKATGMTPERKSAFKVVN